MTHELYPPGARALQDHFGSRPLADRMAELIISEELGTKEQTFISEQSFFLLSTVDTDGFPDVSYKGGAPGFVRCPDAHTIEFPSYDGNGMYRSLGNIIDTGKVALLFLSFDPPRRIRVHGTAEVLTDETSRSRFVEADAVVRVTMGRNFPNCPRYIHDLAAGTLSEFAPREGHETPTPEWKSRADFADVIPPKP